MWQKLFLRALCIPAARTLTVLLLSITGRNKVKILPQSMENFAYHHNHNDHDHYSCIPTTRSCNNLLEVAQNYKLLNLPSSGNSIYPIIKQVDFCSTCISSCLDIFKRLFFFVKKKWELTTNAFFLRFCLIFEHYSQCKHKSRLLTFSVSSLGCGFIFSNNISFIY